MRAPKAREIPAFAGMTAQNDCHTMLVTILGAFFVAMTASVIKLPEFAPVYNDSCQIRMDTKKDAGRCIYLVEAQHCLVR